ncbi:TMV resistance protein N-like [Neltuma alba]|uniref:TMV resistance protein N-like n=1 Tax=Neltuma alba TaxID=207710 RepID=UPI0010A3CFD3|nr:TMV resistance protein N-like [Prosopis alba]
MCLKELTKIMKFRKAYYDVVLPIFCEVSRSQVRNQEFSFGEALQGTDGEVSSWRRALREAGGNYGFDVPNLESNTQREEIIDHIIHRVREILAPPMCSAENTVGVDSRVQDVITMLHNHKSKHVIMVGICGIAGIGKTIVAKAIFEHIHWEFEDMCYLGFDGEDWQREKVDLVSRLRTQIGSLMLKHKKVLLVLDDVNQLEQLNTLCGSRDHFGEGSIIIITTRDLSLLNAFQVDDTYHMQLLSDQESLQLLIWQAFGQPYPIEEFMGACKEVVAYAEGLPLALKVLGCTLRSQPLQEWSAMLQKLSRLQYFGISNILKLSLASLSKEQREIFLNIVEFYIGEDLNDVIQELKGNEFYAHIDIEILQDRGLITIDDNKLRMHNLLQLMGSKIIHETVLTELQIRGYRYEVFLSFRGDTRKNFTSHLYAALCNAGITVFKDDVELPRGKYINTELLQAIGSSKISIIIFSSEYAGSKWCLKELSMIMRLRKSEGRVVLPVFYHVDPSEIRHQTSNFGKAFEDFIRKSFQSKPQVSEWRETLTKAGSLAGTVVLSAGDESDYVDDIVRQVCDILCKTDLFVAEHPVGVDSRVREVITMLQNHSSGNTVTIGIWGMGGAGKTTIAKAIYNEIGRTFKSRSYLSNIRKE